MRQTADSLDQKILSSAQAEFYRYGYQEASLRRICKEAGVTTGALYKRFKNKDALFQAVVRPALEAIQVYGQEQRLRDYQFLEGDRLSQMWEHRLEEVVFLMQLLYRYKKDMQLLLFHSQGSSQEGFKSSLPRYASEETYQYLKEAYEGGHIASLIERPFLDAAMFAYYSAFFEPLAQDWPEEQALAFCQEIVKLFDWSRLLGF